MGTWECPACNTTRRSVRQMRNSDDVEYLFKQCSRPQCNAGAFCLERYTTNGNTAIRCPIGFGCNVSKKCKMCKKTEKIMGDVSKSNLVWCRECGAEPFCPTCWDGKSAICPEGYGCQKHPVSL